jgi:predicted ATP-grasp superfamily ATP-dependent carboligase
LVAATGLTGVNGLDFILDGDMPLVLEVNPRPTATIDLYDADIEAGVVALHLRACRGELPAAPVLRQPRAHAIVYAATAVRVPPRLSWPGWCTDLPEAGTVIPVGAPVCSVHGEADTARQARLLVQSRREQIEANLWAQVA